jgi:hypothetical protein
VALTQPDARDLERFFRLRFQIGQRLDRGQAEIELEAVLTGEVDGGDIMARFGQRHGQMCCDKAGADPPLGA